MTFAARLRQLRDRQDMSEATLAKKAGLPVGTLHHYALGMRRPSFAAVVKIARALGVTCEAFADCEDIDEAEKKAAKKPRRRKG